MKPKYTISVDLCQNTNILMFEENNKTIKIITKEKFNTKKDSNKYIKLLKNASKKQWKVNKVKSLKKS